jgi:hypothetical protein
MMKSLALELTETRTRISRTRIREGVEADLQACLINMATQRGSDPMHPERGTELLVAATSGMLIDPLSAKHQANFAALDTLYFVVRPVVEGREQIDRLEAEILPVGPQDIVVALSGETTSGRPLSTTTNLLLG